MFSEIRKTISSGCVSKMDIGFGSLSFTVNVRLPTPISIFGAAGRVPADGARWTRFHETFATIIRAREGIGEHSLAKKEHGDPSSISVRPHFSPCSAFRTERSESEVKQFMVRPER